ncbi:MAG TPA: MFS transporter [Gammaproteobacteria bacterium]|nr:MFS transporter [Gammaproteobacteria bacterium]
MMKKNNNQFALLRERRFLPFFITQFLGAFNDNFFKIALVLMLTYQTVRPLGMESRDFNAFCGALFILPFFLFSATAGQLADKFDKAVMMRAIKLFEIVIMSLGALGFGLHSAAPLVMALFLMGLHSTLFGPVKYSFLPQHLDEAEIVGGNGLVEMGTNVAILLGEIAGGLLIADRLHGHWLVAAGTLAVAAAGYAAARQVPPSPPADPALRVNFNPITETWRSLRFARGNRTVFLSLLGISWFWFYGLVFLSLFPDLAKGVLHGDESVVVVLLTVFSIGVGVGSLLCERLSGHKVEMGLVPFGSLGLTLFGVDFYLACRGYAPLGTAMTMADFLRSTGTARLLADLAGIGLFGGFYIVPLYAVIQTRSERTHTSRVIAANNILNAFLMVCSAGFSIGLFKLGLDIPQVLLTTALVNIIVAIFICALVPEYFVRFLIWLLVHSLYHLRVRGDEHLPETGGALLIANRVTYIDALMIAAGSHRPIHFVITERELRRPFFGFLLRRMGAVIKRGRWRREVEKLMRAGHLVCVFPAPEPSSDGRVPPFVEGLNPLLSSRRRPVLVLTLRGAWGTLFSREHSPALKRVWRGLTRPLELAITTPLPQGEITPANVREELNRLYGDGDASPNP